MIELGKTYYYQTKGGTIKHSVLVGQTKAWNIFENGDWIESYSPLYETKEQLQAINGLVHAMYVNTYVPDMVHVPNAYLK